MLLHFYSINQSAYLKVPNMTSVIAKPHHIFNVTLGDSFSISHVKIGSISLYL